MRFQPGSSMFLLFVSCYSINLPKHVITSDASETIKFVRHLAETNRPHTILANLSQLLLDLNRGYSITPSGSVFELLDFNVKLATYRPNHFHVVKLDPSFGLIHLIIPFDREQLCPDVQNTILSCILNFLLVYRNEQSEAATEDRELSRVDLGRIAYIDLSVVVTDVNDNVPQFPPVVSSMNVRTRTVFIEEECLTGTLISLPVAIDADSLQYGVRSYEFHPTTSLEVTRHFQIVNVVGSGITCETETIKPEALSSSKPFDIITPCLQVIDRIDREKVGNYQFNLLAIDTGNNKGEVEIQLIIRDINDHYPVWSKTLVYFDSHERPRHVVAQQAEERVDRTPSDRSRYIIHVRECSTQTKLVHLKADDPDDPTSVNSYVTYHMTERPVETNLKENRLMIANDYLILTNTGFRNLDSANWTVTVLARDGGGLDTEAEFLFQIDECNNHKPLILMRQEVYNVKENLSGISHLVTLITVRDLDKAHSQNSAFHCLLNDTKYLTLKEVARGPSVDTDVSDGAFLESPSNKTLPEYDSTMKGQWSIYHLRTHPYTPFDREATDRYVVMIQCSDKGTPALSSNRPITINIMDINDNRPNFLPLDQYTLTPKSWEQWKATTPPKFSFYVSENAEQGLSVGQLLADDMDLGENARLTFELIRFPESQSAFAVQSHGEICLVKALDRETQDQYQLEVRVKDNGSPNSLSSTATVLITVLDVNDCSPQFNGDYVYELVESYASAPIHCVLGYLNATDCDLGLNGSIKYRLTPTLRHVDTKDPRYISGVRDRIASELLQVSTDGKLTVHGVVDREKTPVIMVDVIAEDEGTPRRLSALTTVTVHVMDLNDNKPRFIDPTVYLEKPGVSQSVLNHVNKNYVFTMNLSLDTSVGTEIFKLNAIDPDDGPNGTVDFELISPNHHLNVHSDEASDSTPAGRSQTFTLQPDGRLLLTSQLTFDQLHPAVPGRTGVRYRRPDRLLIKASDRGPTPEQSVTVVQLFYHDTRMVGWSSLDSSLSGAVANKSKTMSDFWMHTRKSEATVNSHIGSNQLTRKERAFGLPIFYVLAIAICFTLLLIICSLIYIHCNSKRSNFLSKPVERVPNETPAEIHQNSVYSRYSNKNFKTQIDVDPFSVQTDTAYGLDSVPRGQRSFILTYEEPNKQTMPVDAKDRTLTSSEGHMYFENSRQHVPSLDYTELVSTHSSKCALRSMNVCQWTAPMLPFNTGEQWFLNHDELKIQFQPNDHNLEAPVGKAYTNAKFLVEKCPESVEVMVRSTTTTREDSIQLNNSFTGKSSLKSAGGCATSAELLQDSGSFV